MTPWLVDFRHPARGRSAGRCRMPSRYVFNGPLNFPRRRAEQPSKRTRSFQRTRGAESVAAGLERSAWPESDNGACSPARPSPVVGIPESASASPARSGMAVSVGRISNAHEFAGGSRPHSMPRHHSQNAPLSWGPHHVSSIERHSARRGTTACTVNAP